MSRNRSFNATNCHEVGSCQSPILCCSNQSLSLCSVCSWPRFYFVPHPHPHTICLSFSLVGFIHYKTCFIQLQRLITWELTMNRGVVRTTHSSKISSPTVRQVRLIHLHFVSPFVTATQLNVSKFFIFTFGSFVCAFEIMCHAVSHFITYFCCCCCCCLQNVWISLLFLSSNSSHHSELHGSRYFVSDGHRFLLFHFEFSVVECFRRSSNTRSSMFQSFCTKYTHTFSLHSLSVSCSFSYHRCFFCRMHVCFNKSLLHWLLKWKTWFVLLLGCIDNLCWRYQTP